MSTRREFLRTTARLALAAGPGLLAGGCAETPPAPAPHPKPAPHLPDGHVPRVDAHVHCFAGLNNPQYPYAPQGPYEPEVAATPEKLLATMRGARVDYAIIVHPEPYQDDHRYLEHCLEVGKGKLKGTCLFFAERPESPEKLSELAKRIPLVALRIHAYAPDRLPPFGKSELRELWKQATELGLAVQLHFEPRYARGFYQYIHEFEDATTIIDHLGRPLQGTPEEHARVIAWSRFPNTVIKLSGLTPKSEYPHRDIAPIVRQLVNAFGPDRMIYGGGFHEKATPESYRAAFERARSYISFLPEEDQAKILGGTAARLFGFVKEG